MCTLEFLASVVQSVLCAVKLIFQIFSSLIQLLQSLCSLRVLVQILSTADFLLYLLDLTVDAVDLFIGLSLEPFQVTNRLINLIINILDFLY